MTERREGEDRRRKDKEKHTGGGKQKVLGDKRLEKEEKEKSTSEREREDGG